MSPFDPGRDEWFLNGTKIIQRNVLVSRNEILVVQKILADYGCGKRLSR